METSATIILNPPEPRKRVSLQKMQEDYDSGNRQPLRDLIKAWKGIQELPPSDPNSFFTIAGYHGEPFRGPGAGSTSLGWWGGFCHHGNVLFPTWHRAYVLRLENALRSIQGCEHVTMPFWDECLVVSSILEQNDSEQQPPQSDPDQALPRLPSQPPVIPTVLTSKTFDLEDGQGPILNPLYSYTLAKEIKDLAGDDADYSKPEGYTTVRYPLSGLVGGKDVVNSIDHNRIYADESKNCDLLNANVLNWLTGSIKITPDPGAPTRYPDTFSVYERFKRCLEAEKYNIFSNTTSQAYWIEKDGHAGRNYYESLESPHNAIHLAVGGFYVPGEYDADEILGANGDMGENDTAAFDPIFFFHHCFIDHVFWLWQQRNGKTNDLGLVLDYNDPGLNSTGVAGVAQGEMLSLDTKLYPFEYTSRGVVNIEQQLKYTYGPSSLSQYALPPDHGGFTIPSFRKKLGGTVEISGLSRDAISGSFVVEIRASRTVNGKKEEHLVDRQAILSRWGIQGCLNCRNHLELKSFAPVQQSLLDEPGEGWAFKSTVKDRKYSGIAKPHLELNPKGVTAALNFVKF
ncbi:uncharacterized protein DFL_000210 [Arthrobotrys flagrans]|uniref:tyrosinase n=1 Tax=Arthrobotrys flagrans TaxID=97331 RepID=A0A437AD99_ARTFL|nr:hypothetical protein DFL_000210 [Arthrobotrys flagrans]